MKHKLLRYSSIIATLTFLVVFYGLAFKNTPESKAVKATDFKAGRIVDDGVFYNADSMTVDQIQSFMDRVLPSCDMWGTGKMGSGYYINGRAVDPNTTRKEYARRMREEVGDKRYHAPPYVCINKYYENPQTHVSNFDTNGNVQNGMLSAAQIIYNAAKEYNINPQVLLVMLKKESYAWGDDWPTKNEYNTVMGYACPDNAACDTKYYGFYNQVNMAAWQLDYYKKHIYSYNYRPYATNNIYYSPTYSCGSKKVYIENYATASLYIYTPYTPNDAALRNYPGTASCGSYGNRNFFMYFVEWFGTTRAPEKPVQTTTEETPATEQQPAEQQTDQNKPADSTTEQQPDQTTQTPTNPNAAIEETINQKYVALGGANVFGEKVGTLGNNAKTGIYWQDYKNGVVVGNDKYGYYESRGKIRARWQSLGFEGGVLGFPTGNIQTNAKTGIYWQNYTGGVIVGNDRYGYYESRGKIRSRWQSLGFEGGALGFPTSNIQSNSKTGIYWQNYSGGVIVGNDKYGYYESRGKLREYWKRNGFESGKMGFPTSNIMTSGKTIYQKYSRGTLYYNAANGRYTWK